MIVKCGWASIGETGRGRGNKAGDQTGREVKTGDWYDFGQNVMLRFKKRIIAEAYAKAIRQMCNNQNVGYDMSDRDTLWDALNKVGWDVTKIVKPVECDCSMLVGCGVNIAVGKALIGKEIYTGNLVNKLMETRMFEKYTDAKYLRKSDYLLTGDILNRAEHHVISVIDGHTDHAVARPTLRKGDKSGEVELLQNNLNSVKGLSGAKLVEDGDFGSKTKAKVESFQKKSKILIDGIYGKVTASSMNEVIK